MPTYPESPASNTTDMIHGIEVADPWRWLEELESPQTRGWIEAQNVLTQEVLGSMPGRASIRARLEGLWRHERFGVPRRRGDRYFFLHNDGTQDQYTLQWTDDLKGSTQMLLDPNTLSEDGTVALSSYSASVDGRLLAYGISDGGSDWTELRVRDVDTGKDLADRVRWVKFSSMSWTHDKAGFFYSRYDAPDDAGATYKAVNTHHKLYYHQLGTDQEHDRLVYARSDKPGWIFDGQVTEDGRFLIISVYEGSQRKNGLCYVDLKEAPDQVVELLGDFDARYTFLDNIGSTFYLMTDRDAPMSRVVALDLNRPEYSAWAEIIPASTDTLQSARRVGGQWIAHYLHHAHSDLRAFAPDGRPLGSVALPGQGTVSVGHGRGDTLFYAFTGFTRPTTIYSYAVDNAEEIAASTIFKSPNVDFNPDDYVTRQIFFESRDGTRVPMFIGHKKGLALDGARPTYMHGYGGFGSSQTPLFSLAFLTWMEMGGVFALPNLRGGGEYGATWHEAGTKLRKQNVFDDFIAAAQWLFDNNWTRPDRLAIGGGSNGGLLVGACMTQRPELFGACLPAVGVLDMLRFPYFTIGRAWVSDYGSPEDPEEFKALLAYSPYHNTQPGTRYPATLITTGDHDDRVFPAHSFKFAAALQTAQGGEAPVLIRIETRAGHGAGTAESKLIDLLVDRWSFLAKHLSMDLTEVTAQLG